VTSRVSVVKVGGRAQGDPALDQAIAAQIKNGRRVCVVHGGGDEVSAMQRRLGMEPRFSGGRRVTSEEELEVVRMVLSGTTNKRLVARFSIAGLRAVGISGEDGGLFSAGVVDAKRMGRVGGALQVDAALVRHLLAGGYVPVISPLSRDAGDPQGSGLNVNGDDAAAALAGALGADELVLVADVAGVLDNGHVVPELDDATVRAMIADGRAGGGMAAKLEAALAASKQGVDTVRITDISGIPTASAGTRVLAGVGHSKG